MLICSGTELINPSKLLLKAGLKEGEYVADLGCGSLGHIIFPAAEIVGSGGIAYAVDIQKGVLERVEKTAKQNGVVNLKTIWSDIDIFGAAPIEAGSLDLTLLVNNLYLSKDRPALVREMARLTKAGGRAVVVEWSLEKSPLGPPIEQRIGLEDAKKIFASPLFTALEVFAAGPYHYGLLFNRTEIAP
ncbi:methyltransferase domain-containing protein [Patescibacteria group bacterium]|nr:methyltransferase domain-containing protein [Patescibacteria group bacterium]